MNTSSYRNRNNKENLDRFIPNRSAMDFDYAHFALTERRREDEEISASRESYNKQLAEALNLNRTRILAFRNKPPSTSSVHSFTSYQPLKPPRLIPQRPERTLDAPGIVDDMYLNVLDWGNANVLAIALDNSVFLWNGFTGSVTELVTYDEDKGPVTSVNWAHDGIKLGVGLNNGEVHIWDCQTKSLLRTVEGCHHKRRRVGSLAWNSHILTTGGMDGRIFNHDVRIMPNAVATTTYKGHTQEVCGLKWSGSGQRLASGGKDSLVHIWDLRSTTQWLHRLRGHTSAVTALGWCPFQTNLLASGEEDGMIKFWNTQTGACLNSVDTASQVSSLLWSNRERELLSSHGSQLTLWKYPSMVKMAELSDHKSRVLSMTQSPDGCTVVSVAGDEQLMFWNVFGVPGTAKKPVPKAAHEPFSHVARSIR